MIRAGIRALPLALLVFASGCSRKDPAGSGSSASGAAGDSVHAGSKERPQFVAPTPFQAPPPYAELIRDYRKTWTNLTGYEHSGLHWGQFVTIYINQEPEKYAANYLEYVRVYLSQDIDEDEEEEAGADTAKHFQAYSRGTIFLKEHYLPLDGKPGKPLSITLMIKREPGFDPGAGDWEFVQISPEGNVLFSGRSQDPVIQQMCIKCHANMAERDYVFSTFCNIANAPEP